MTEEVIGIRLRADGVVETTNGIVLTGVSFENLGKKADAAAPQVQRVGVSAGQTANAMRQLPSQITDIVTQLAGGQPVWQIAIQQGGQLKDSFGGLVPMGRALLGTLTPVNLAIGSAAAVLGGLAMAAFAGARESAETTKQLALMGDTAGFSAGQFHQLNQRLATDSRLSVGAVRDVTIELLKIPAVGGPAFESAGRAAINLQKLTGQSATEIAQQLSKLSGNVVAGAAQLNAAYGFLSAAQYAQIQSLSAQGRSVEAVRLVMGELADTMQQRTGPTMGWLGKQIEEHDRIWGHLWETLKGIGGDTSAEDRLAELQQRLQANAQAASRGNFFSRWLLPDMEAEEAAFRNLVNRDQVRAAERRAAQATEQEQIENMSAAHQAALANIARAGSAVLLAEVTVGYARQQAAADLAFQRGELSAAAYQSRLLAIENGRINASIQSLDRLYAYEAKRKPQNENESINQAATLRQIEAQRILLLERRIKLKSDEDLGNRDQVPKSTPINRGWEETQAWGRLDRDSLTRDLGIGSSQQLKNVRQAEVAMEEQTARESVLARMAAAHDLVETNKRLNIDLIRDDRARAEAQIAQEEDELRKRLDLDALNAADRKKVEDDFANWRVLRERQLNESLKPEWQRMLEAWSDTNKQMKDDWDGIMAGALRSGEDFFRQWARTGKFNIQDLFATLRGEVAASLFRQGAGSLARSAWGSIGSLFSFGSPSNAASIDAAATAWAGWFHGGGIAGGTPAFSRTMLASTWAGAPRFHGGGLASDEVPAILRKKEGVFTEEQMKALAPVGAASGRSVVYAPVNHYNIDARSDKDQIMALIAKGNQAALADFVDKMDRGQI